jgi:uncharacterized protein (DUF433 family)
MRDIVARHCPLHERHLEDAVADLFEASRRSRCCAPGLCHSTDVEFGGRFGHMRFVRITVDPNQMGGVPCIRGLRIPVASVVGMVADGMSEPDILEAFPDLEQEDIREALRYAAEAVRERELPLVKTG